MIPWPTHCDFTTKGKLSPLNEALCVWECICTTVDVFFEYQRHTWWIVCKVKHNYMLDLSNTWNERNTNSLREYSYLGSTLLYGSCFLGLVWHYGLTSSAYNVACFFWVPLWFDMDFYVSALFVVLESGKMKTHAVRGDLFVLRQFTATDNACNLCQTIPQHS